MAKKLLLCIRNEWDKAFVQEIAKSLGYATVYLDAIPALGPELQNPGDVAGVFVDLTDLEQGRQLTETCQGKFDPNQVHVLLSPDGFPALQKIFENPSIGQFVLRKPENLQAEAEHYARIVKATAERDRSFSLPAILPPASAIETTPITESAQRYAITSKVNHYLKNRGCQERVASVIANAVDELLMNAIFDAPIDSEGKSMFESTPRTHDIKLTGRHAVEMQLGSEGAFIGITITDLMGSLNRLKVLKHISKSLEGKQHYELETRKAGAGLGLALILRSGGSLCFVTERGKRTGVTVIFKNTNRYKDLKGQLQFISTQVYE